MQRLTVLHKYDPETGFIVSQEVIELPAVLRDGLSLRDAIVRGRETGLPVVVFATADRCAPCQQYKKDAINDAAVIERLRRSDVIVTHIEVDQESDEALKWLSSTAIPMTYLIKEAAVVDALRGQRSASQLQEWLVASLSE